ncbi:MAG: tripartite tricarboxylate transporter substrate binding protein [Comamonadaceae bacterium]|nr:MAG: tripartite tricarboxylate transporter substrate binding protein [Comamonadaceae bacterium]
MRMRATRRGAWAAAWAAIAALTVGLPLPAGAQPDWPSKPIRMIVGFAAGGPTDSFARVVAKKLGEQLGQQVVVENRAGANANVAAEAVARAPADGHTVLYNSSSIAISATLYKNLRYDVRKDLVPVSLLMSLPIIMVVNPAFPVTTPQELVARLKAEPGRYNYASGGAGNAQHLGMAMVMQRFGTAANHIPYKGSSAAYIDLLGGRVEFMIDAAGSLAPYVKDGRLRPIAALSEQRLPEHPNLPTMAESGMPGFELEGWYGVMVPARTPQAIVQRLHAELSKAMNSDELKAALATQGGRPLVSTPQQYQSYLEAEISRYGKVIGDLDIKAE